MLILGITETGGRAGKNPARGPYRKKAGPVTCVRLANQIRGFRHPARSDASGKKKVLQRRQEAQLLLSNAEISLQSFRVGALVSELNNLDHNIGPW